MTNQPEPGKIFLASIALEPNRWEKESEKVPSLRVSEMSKQASSVGFDGWELWEHHYFKTDEAERQSLRASVLPVSLFNTYLRPAFEPDESWKRVVAAIESFGEHVRGIKFNLGNTEIPLKRQIEAALRWAELLPEGVRMLCECHPGTCIDTPEAAAFAFRHWPASRFGAILHPFGNDSNHCQRWFDALGNRIEHLHWQAQDAEGARCRLASCGTALDVIANSLRNYSYNGTHSIEFVEGTNVPGETVKGLLVAAFADLKTLRGLF